MLAPRNLLTRNCFPSISEKNAIWSSKNSSPLSCSIYLMVSKIYICIIYYLWDVIDRQNSAWSTRKTYQHCTIKTMNAGGLANQGACERSARNLTERARLITRADQNFIRSYWQMRLINYLIIYKIEKDWRILVFDAWSVFMQIPLDLQIIFQMILASEYTCVITIFQKKFYTWIWNYFP